MFFTPKLPRARRLGRRGNFVDRRPVVGSNLITTYPDQRSIIESITFFFYLEVSARPLLLCLLNGCRVKLAVCHFFFPVFKKTKKNKYSALFCSIVSIIIAGVITLRSEVSHRRSFTVKRWTDKRRAAHQTKSIVCLHVSFDLPICRRKWHFCPRNARLRGNQDCHVCFIQ